MKTPKLDFGTKRRLKRKIARAYHNAQDFGVGNRRRKLYWNRQADKLLLRLYGTNVWTFQEVRQPLTETVHTLEHLTKMVVTSLVIPQSILSP